MAGGVFSYLHLGSLVGPNDVEQIYERIQTLKDKRAFSNHIDIKSLLTHKQTVALESLSCLLAATSLLGSLVALYWFIHMRKRFRHELILILILGDLLRSVWYFVLPLVDLLHGQIESGMPLCQAGGFMAQVGIETSDYAILVIAIHTALQVFNPRIEPLHGGTENGLYKYRYAVYAGAVTLPSIMCSLAFIQKKGAYLSQGPTCSLPLRPFWYRLAISWIPRYVILCIVGGLYFAIFIHSQEPTSRWKHLSRAKRESKLWVTVVDPEQGNRHTDGLSEPTNFALVVNSNPDYDLDPLSRATNPIRAQSYDRRVSEGTTLGPSSVPPSIDYSTWTNELSDFGRRGTTVSFGGDSGRDSYDRVKQDDQRTAKPSSYSMPTIPHHKEKVVHDLVGQKIVTQQMKNKQSEIQHQLRLLLAYPVVYFAIWFFPFVLHACNYNNYRAQHPIFALYILAYASLASMGAINCLMFGLRERPWRHISGSNGTFWGSFCFWRHCDNRKASYATTSTLQTARNQSEWGASMMKESDAQMTKEGEAQSRRNTLAPSFRDRLESMSQTRPPNLRSLSDAPSPIRERLQERHRIDDVIASAIQREAQRHVRRYSEFDTIDFAFSRTEPYKGWQRESNAFAADSGAPLDKGFGS